MRKASFVLGIVGGSLALLMALLFIACGILLMAINSDFIQRILDVVQADVPHAAGFLFDWSTDVAGITAIVIGGVKAVCGVLGLVGGLSVKTNNVTAGVLMIVAAGVSLIITGAWITTVLLTLGGIFALVKEKPPVVTSQTPLF